MSSTGFRVTDHGVRRVLSYERQREVLRRVRVRGAGNVNELATIIGVSPSTIRRDLTELDEQGLLRRVHGGASVPDSEGEVAHIAREAAHTEQKLRIGEAAAKLVRNHSTILVTGGTTTEAMLVHLHGREGLTVVTNGLNVAMELSRQPAITVVVLGGVLRHAELSLLGALAEDAMKDFHVDAAFIGAYGVDPVTGLSGASVLEASTDRRLLDRVPAVVALADSSKFGRRGPVRLAGIDQVATLITDTGAPAAAVAALAEAEVDVRLV
jgi:DeoR/GlpR family transcriptional regulator of sugar metabolism